MKRMEVKKATTCSEILDDVHKVMHSDSPTMEVSAVSRYGRGFIIIAICCSPEMIKEMEEEISSVIRKRMDQKYGASIDEKVH